MRIGRLGQKCESTLNRYQPITSIRSARANRLRQHDIHCQHFVVALFFQRHLDVVRIDQDIFGNDGEDVYKRQVSLLSAASSCIKLSDSVLATTDLMK